MLCGGEHGDVREGAPRTVAVPEYTAWVNAGRPYTLAQPIIDLKAWAKVNAVPWLGDLGNEAHLQANPPEDHTPYSYTAWPLPLPGYIVSAIDLKEGPTTDALFNRLLADGKAGRLPWLKYMNYRGSHYNVRSAWVPRTSSDYHLHISVASTPTALTGSIAAYLAGGTVGRKGCDYSFSRPTIAALKSAGVTFAVRYLSAVTDATRGKLLTKGEADTLRANDIDVVSNWEFYAKPTDEKTFWGVTDMRELGRRAAAEANRQHLACGGPPDAPIYVSLDFDMADYAPTGTAAAKLGVYADYLRGWADVLGCERVGVYGSFYVVQRALDAGLCRYAWQTFAWSGGLWDARTHIRQVQCGVSLGGAQVDINQTAADTGFGEWGFYQQGGDDMYSDNDRLRDDQTHAAIRALLWNWRMGGRDGYIKAGGRADVWDFAGGLGDNELHANLARVAADVGAVKSAVATTNLNVSLNHEQLLELAESVAQSVAAQDTNALTDADVPEVAQAIVDEFHGRLTRPDAA